MKGILLYGATGIYWAILALKTINRHHAYLMPSKAGG